MKGVTYSDSLMQDTRLFKLAEKTTRLLDHESSKGIEDEVSAAWDVSNGTPSVREPQLLVRLSYPQSSAYEVFTLSELNQPDEFLEFKLRRLWRRLLREESHRLLEVMKSLDGSEVTAES